MTRRRARECATDAGATRTSPRARGIAKMEEVYGFSVDPDEIAGTVRGLHRRPPLRSGVDPARLDIRDRRLMTIGVLAALGQPQLVEIQFQSALDRDELDRGAGPRDGRSI